MVVLPAYTKQIVRNISKNSFEIGDQKYLEDDALMIYRSNRPHQSAEIAFLLKRVKVTLYGIMTFGCP